MVRSFGIGAKVERIDNSECIEILFGMVQQIAKVDNKELSVYVSSVLDGISQGITSGYVLSPSMGVKFQIGITNEIQAEGGMRILVADAGAGASSKADSTIEFQVIPKPRRPFSKPSV